ncbi:uncharacterized protein HMPREF1120_08477 [Exophiala dermatitidis NIH/UT8656]|uniref:Uncharacterized protein n=1 Tax=Exophiala dermatitidis (strain ATCC 34100 / CBS 525.76 / NIH/UT8656) TaxID=858893 RepID=H6C8U4_EXODN|nr:uncharacterized protein HMPREF1120_08477 [Exophiala dermatitidis NIH/UT8656]EHY60521.1 hypothetical protein HMPREF1120_08477 [Exophiala dermatitidis NIH/UT8656]
MPTVCRSECLLLLNCNIASEISSLQPCVFRDARLLHDFQTALVGRDLAVPMILTMTSFNGAQQPSPGTVTAISLGQPPRRVQRNARRTVPSIEPRRRAQMSHRDDSVMVPEVHLGAPPAKLHKSV